jgi:hypothetical protein
VTDEDRRGLTALFWSHVNRFGTFRLDMDKRLDLLPWPFLCTYAGGRLRAWVSRGNSHKLPTDSIITFTTVEASAAREPFSTC